MADTTFGASVSGGDSLSMFLNKLYALAAEGRPGLKTFGRMLVADTPDDVETVCKSPEIFNKDYGYVLALGRSRFSEDGTEWEVRRDITQPFYVEASRPTNRDDIAAVYAEHLGACDCAQSINVRDAVLAASLSIFHRALGADIPLSETMQLADRMRQSARELQRISLFGAAPPARQAAVANAKAVVAGAEARCTGPLKTLMEGFTSRSKGLSGFAPVEEYIFNLFAGVETSVAVISWAIDRLGLDEGLQEELAAEVRSGDEVCARLECFINETMRYFPAIPLLVRRVAAETRLAGQPLHPGQHILVSLIGLHQNPRCWQRPTVFDPRRAEFRDGTYDRRAFLPFSTGARVCGGARLARMEVSEGIKAFLGLYRVARQEAPLSVDFVLAMRPDSWRELTIAKR